MAQIFGPQANGIVRFVLLLFGLGLLFWVLAMLGILRSGYVTNVGEAPAQPLPFSHEHHVRGLGIDCRYCHDTVETSAFAGIPATHTCMSCHSQVWTQDAMLAPLRASLNTGQPLSWTRVNNLADFVYFDHSIHVHQGIGCATCHGAVDRMPLMRAEHAFRMRFCLDCHRQPEPHLRPRGEVFNMDWEPTADQPVAGRRLRIQRGIEPDTLSDCYICHR